MACQFSQVFIIGSFSSIYEIAVEFGDYEICRNINRIAIEKANCTVNFFDILHRGTRVVIQ